jgi:hypothetical protein
VSGVDEPAHHRAARIQLGYRGELALVEPAPGEGAVQPAPDAAVGGVEDVADGVACRERDRDQVAQGVVGVAGGVGACDPRPLLQRMRLRGDAGKPSA